MQFKSLAAVALVLASVSPAAADTTTTIDAKSNRGTWEGWGTSLAWWARRFGTRDDLADIFFTTKTTSFGGASLPGLGFNIVRHNAGACSWNSIGGESMVVSPKMMLSRQIEGHWIDWNSADPASSSWKWDVDASQRAMMQKAKSRGANRFELFSNSPMWWMTKNHNPSGSADGSENIQSWNLAQHAVYMATIAKYAKDNWGITFESVEPFNEPTANWWKADGTQEGCHIDVATQATIINALRTELNNRGLNSMTIAASDESYYDQAVTTLNGLGNAALKNVARINVHGYQYANGKRDQVFSLSSARGLRLWNSEYGENDATGERLVSNLLLDFRWLKPTGWVYWQVLDGGGWGVIDADNEAGTLGSANQKYFVFAQFARHIREGMRILDGGADNVVAAYDAARSKLVIVAVNWGDAQYLNFDLSKFTQASTNGAKVTRWRTQIGSGDRYVQASDTTMSGTKFWSYFEKKMVQTFEVDNVKL
ncbi:glycoside hydrolase family 30 protein [Colletotrichum tofieldiae]|uniref:Glycoside hydrolase family 30 protein (Endo-beta-1,6-galactanase) n=1 Tax=Colletotrichum tofieldiae TaxID=708197 RepID=A0A161WKS1_9PEZI|nr:glycoside hydrolase family 30 protein (endo-beta-1,6-galactanase) [Colletotrichum tofieldiae]GKT65671.1 glycoside hydrolase family 30 protein [Colletotrichum tofieldiae]GKT71144.1 glycoside hydrolase family 30 protein [Colletotrichum tofieldiae]GKT93945.1 glycoside hydrolase family 30 protein [Colletotrichum tofieldiae]